MRDVGVEFSVGVGGDEPVKDVVDGSTQVDDVEEEQRESVESEDSGSGNSDQDVVEKTVKKSKKLKNLFSFSRKKEKVV